MSRSYRNAARVALGALIALGLLSTIARAGDRYERALAPAGVSVEIVDASGRRFEEFPAKSGRPGVHRAYLRAERGAPYRIRLRNDSPERVGLVIAVDGRNVISGKRSELRRGEPMYVLDPWQSDDISGWRTSLSDVHEFYFTEWEDSYAEAFGDRSARGVIAVAVYRERGEKRHRYAEADRPAPSAPAVSGRAQDAPRARKESRADDAASEPGTGYGDRRYEPATRVAFEAESRAAREIYLKYEWPETLCRRGILACERNRFWDDSYGFAPPPPRSRVLRP